MAKLVGKICTWLDKRYVISQMAQRAAIQAQNTGASFDALYEELKRSATGKRNDPGSK